MGAGNLSDLSELTFVGRYAKTPNYWALRAPIVLYFRQIFSEDMGIYESADSTSSVVCTIRDGEPLSCGQV
jgi:hypothetical protein